MRSLQVATALCALCALLACAMATEQKMFAEAWHEAKAGVASGAKPSSSYEPADVKNLCLQEGNQYNCRTVGCQNYQVCPEDATDCPDCVTNLVFQSDLTCCGDRSGLYESGPPPAPATADWQSPYLRIGTCDWDITVNEASHCLFNPSAAGCTGRRLGGDNSMWAQRVGSAWATCYLTEGSEYCDDTLCDKMVVTFQGGFYLSAIRSTTPNALRDTNTNICGPDWRSVTMARQSASKAPAAKKATNKGAKASTESYRGHKEEEVLYPGVAWVMSGSITVTSVEKKVSYQTGHMDYVYDFMQLDAAVLAKEFGPGDYTKMTPNTYKIKMVGDKKATY